MGDWGVGKLDEVDKNVQTPSYDTYVGNVIWNTTIVTNAICYI